MTDMELFTGIAAGVLGGQVLGFGIIALAIWIDRASRTGRI